MAKIAILGYGTVGSGVFEVIRTNQAIVDRNAGEELRIKYVLDLRDFPGDPVEEVLVHDYAVILNDPEVSVVVEVMGGLKPAYTFVLQALEAGKSVCTSNKALVAAYGTELLAAARKNNVSFLFEASCGGGIPIIRPLVTSLTADDVDEISGILNGTTNYILTKMAQEGSDFDDVLKEAQALGYAERDPSADVEGWDACRKIAILMSVATGKYVNFEHVHTEGITEITPEDLAYAKAWNAGIKLLATGKKVPEGTYCMVAPVMIAHSHPLYSINGVFNAIFVHGNMLGDSMFYGSGAGKRPTASAVVGDVIEAVKNPGKTVMAGWTDEPLELMSTEDVRTRFFVRMSGKLSGKRAAVEAVFGQIEEKELPEYPDEFAFVTDEMSEKEYEARAAALPQILGMIRVRF